MAEDYCRRFPGVQQRFDLAGERLGMDLRALLAKGPPKALAATRIAQPAIFTLSYAIADLLAQRGVRPSIVAGHSLGEFTAVAVAQALDFAAALDLVIARGQLMHEISEQVDGGMLAVGGVSAAAIDDLIAQAGGEVWLANVNAPGQYVVAGRNEVLQRFHDLLLKRGGRGTRLGVSGPFHTPLYEPAAAALRARIAELKFRDPVVPVVANASARTLTDASAVRDELCTHMLSPVNWSNCLQRIRDEGADALVEAGPGRVMKGLVLRNDPQAKCFTTSNVREMDETCKVLGGTPCKS